MSEPVVIVGSGLVNHFWNTFDQVRLRPSLLPCYEASRLIVPDKIGGRPILRMAGMDGFSDHLPVIISLAIEKEVSGV